MNNIYKLIIPALVLAPSFVFAMEQEPRALEQSNLMALVSELKTTDAAAFRDMQSHLEEFSSFYFLYYNSFINYFSAGELLRDICDHLTRRSVTLWDIGVKPLEETSPRSQVLKQQILRASAIQVPDYRGLTSHYQRELSAIDPLVLNLFPKRFKTLIEKKIDDACATNGKPFWLLSLFEKRTMAIQIFHSEFKALKQELLSMTKPIDDLISVFKSC